MFYLYSCTVIHLCNVVNHCMKIFCGCYQLVENKAVMSLPGNPKDKPCTL